MLITVAICTWNRSRLLREALEQMTKLVLPGGIEWELLVVNNNSTDDTEQVIASFSHRLPIQRIWEPRPGQSNARNAAIREVNGSYVLWTDDDVLVDPQWIVEYVKAFERWPNAVIFGGPIRPWFSDPPPEWLKRVWQCVAGVYAMRDLGDRPIRFDGDKLIPFGANFAVRMQEQRAYPYSPEFGLRPGSELRGDEIEVFRALHAKGYEGWWVPDATVNHFVPLHRMTMTYIRKFYFGYGRYRVLTEPPPSGPTLLGRPRWLWKRALYLEVCLWFHRVFSPPERWIKDLMAVGEAWGRLLSRSR